MHGTPPSTRAARPWPLDDALRGTLSALAFWMAIVLPALYLPLLVAGIQSTDGLVTFLGLVGLHLVALVGGRRYRTATH